MSKIYKIIEEGLWRQAVAAGEFKGAEIDLQDGYIHLSSESQVETTARLHFSGKPNLLLVGFDPVIFGETLKWEASRGGDLFPHVHGTLNPASALWAKALPWNGHSHEFPEGWTS